MKKIILILTAILLISCEETITPDLTTAAPRLVIDAAIDWEKGTAGNIQTIRLTTTTGFYESEVPKVTGATVIVTNSANTVFNFVEVNTGTPTGQYVCSNFVPVIGETYKLTVTSNGQTYTAEEKLTQTPNISNDVEQINTLGLNSDEIGVRIKCNDIANQEDFYILKVKSSIKPFPEFDYQPDLYSQGNLLYFIYSNKKLEKDSQISFKLSGVSERYYTYMKILIGNANGTANGPFQVPPTRVRGNIKNQSNEQNYPIGFFSLSESSKLSYIIK
jgi:Domain of unknown function (DUF4249)